MLYTSVLHFYIIPNLYLSRNISCFNASLCSSKSCYWLVLVMRPHPLYLFSIVFVPFIGGCWSCLSVEGLMEAFIYLCECGWWIRIYFVIIIMLVKQVFLLISAQEVFTADRAFLILLLNGLDLKHNQVFLYPRFFEVVSIFLNHPNMC